MSHDSRRARVIRGLFVVAGTICVALGALGIVLPVLPTTPFLLLAAACYIRGSERMHHWLLNNRWFGSYIKNYHEGRGISAKGKIFSITSLWVAICISIFLIQILPMQVALIIIASAVTTHLLRIPTYRKEDTLDSKSSKNVK